MLEESNNIQEIPGGEMVKKFVAGALILATAGAWFYLDQLNKEELQATAAARQSLEHARDQAKARLGAPSHN
jgi:hypothetical protein